MYIINYFDNNGNNSVKLCKTHESAVENVKKDAEEIAATLRSNGRNSTIRQNIDGTDSVCVFDTGFSHVYQWRIQECEMSEDIPVIVRSIPENQVQKTEQILADNGIAPDKASVVLQALGYTLFNENLYPENRIKPKIKRITACIIDYSVNDNHSDYLVRLYQTHKSAAEDIKRDIKGIVANLRSNGYDPTIQQDMDGATEVYVFDEEVSHCYHWRIQECEMTENMPVILQGIPEIRFWKAEQILAKNGIDPDEVSTVLQAVGYALLDVELYPGN